MLSNFRDGLKTGKRHRLTILRAAGQRCFELPGPHFDFDRSFVRPDGLVALSHVTASLESDPDRTGLIFGHTDTVGSEGYNKLLSERRARAVFAVLTHDAKEWEKLHGQESWGAHQVQVMINRVSGEPPIPEDGAHHAETVAAVKKFQAAHPPLQVDGIAGPKTRHELYLAYFKSAIPTPADPTRFFDFGGERIMGCGEFNPFVPNETKNEKSRRVVVIVFDPGAKPDKLPCKIGSVSGCTPNLVKAGEPKPDPKNPFFRCKVFVKLASKCPKVPPIKGDGSWDVPIDIIDGHATEIGASFDVPDTTPGDGVHEGGADASFSVPGAEPGDGVHGGDADASFSVPEALPGDGVHGAGADASFSVPETLPGDGVDGAGGDASFDVPLVEPAPGDVGPVVEDTAVSEPTTKTPEIAPPKST